MPDTSPVLPTYSKLTSPRFATVFAYAAIIMPGGIADWPADVLAARGDVAVVDIITLSLWCTAPQRAREAADVGRARDVSVITQSTVPAQRLCCRRRSRRRSGGPRDRAVVDYPCKNDPVTTVFQENIAGRRPGYRDSFLPLTGRSWR